MKFYQHKDSWYFCKQLGLSVGFESREEMFRVQSDLAEKNGDPFVWRQSQLELAWIELGRPYYQIFPAVLPALLKLKLDVPCSALKPLQIQPIEIRFPEGVEIPELSWVDGVTGKEAAIKTILLGVQDVASEVGSEELVPGMVICFDFGEWNEIGFPVYSFKFFPMRTDKTVEEAACLLHYHRSWQHGVIVPDSIIENVVRLCACLFLLDNNPELINPDILAKDAAAWDSASEELREKLVAAAHKRGKIGWNVGAGIDVIPHVRRPHPALVWTGKGRGVPKIVMRAGSVVHRSKLTEIPHGFVGED